jgi:hypothetical protein
MQNSERLIKTTLQLKICYSLLKLTELKRRLNEDGWFYKTDIVNLTKENYTTVDSFLQSLAKKGILRYLSIVTKSNWQGGVLRLTERGESAINAELTDLLSFEDVDKSLKKIQPILQ